VIKLLLTIFVFFGCGTFSDPRVGVGVDPEFLPYVLEFERHYGKRIGDIPITFRRLQGDNPAFRRIGECHLWYVPFGVFGEIFIDPDWWYMRSDGVRREMLIFHELGHCELRRPHVEDTVSGRASSLMAPTITIQSSFHYVVNRDYYLKELFGPSRTPFHNSIDRR